MDIDSNTHIFVSQRKGMWQILLLPFVIQILGFPEAGAAEFSVIPSNHSANNRTELPLAPLTNTPSSNAPATMEDEKDEDNSILSNATTLENNILEDAMNSNETLVDYYPLNGRGNNILHPDWGAVNTPRVRQVPLAAAAFFNEQGDPFTEGNSPLPSARRLMEVLFRQVIPRISSNSGSSSASAKRHNHLMLEFGHFIVQDIMGATLINRTEALPIPCDGTVPDIVFCPGTGRTFTMPAAGDDDDDNNNNSSVQDGSNNTNNTMHQGQQSIDFWRAPHAFVSKSTAPNNAAETTKTNPDTRKERVPINGQTSFLDLSSLYGRNMEECEMVRARHDGLLKLDKDNELPPPELHRIFNKSPGVYALHVVFMRFHNMMAKQYATEDTTEGNDEILQLAPEEKDKYYFKKARKYTIAVYQSIISEKYIPTLMGWKLPPYAGYRPTTNPGIDVFFSSVSYRYGHSSLSQLVRILDAEWQPMPKDPLFLRDVFRPPETVPFLVHRYGTKGNYIEPFLRGLTVQPTEAVDLSFVDDLNVWSDAVSLLDIQRGRDVGVPPYNQVREALGLPRMNTIAELVFMSNVSQYSAKNQTNYENGQLVVEALEELYGNDIDKVDAYVGALLENAQELGDNLGPLFTLSMKDQFMRLRDGDRFWYEDVFMPEEYLAFPTLSDVIRQTCESMENFPSDSFIAWSGPEEETKEEDSCGVKAELSLLGGDLNLQWSVDEPTFSELQADASLRRTVDVILAVPMSGPGFVGVGWRSQTMRGAEIWVCRVLEDAWDDVEDSGISDCSDGLDITAQAPLMCCVAPGTGHTQPRCATSDDEVFYELEIINWCLTPTSAAVTLRAPACDDTVGQMNGTIDCFRLSSTEDNLMDFITAFNPNSASVHGFMRRTSAQLNFFDGMLTQGEAPVVEQGLIATHGLFMLFAWMIMAPLAVFIVRYMKTSSWRLTAHISLMGVVGSLMVPLLIGVQASVGATNKAQDHSIVGLILMIVYFFMAFAGRIRYLKLAGRKIGKKTDFCSLVLHKYGGFCIIGTAWWNCYTGLVRIGPEDSYVQAVVFSSIPLGYNLPVFGFIRKYLFFPYIACVGIIFALAEAKRRGLNGSSHMKKMQAILTGETSLWDDLPTEDIEEMTMETFLDLTRMGTALCIVDNYVLDITEFMENHPGGQHLLRYARGSDITEEVIGTRDVDGHRNVHSHSALQLMKTLVRAVLVDPDKKHKVESSFFEKEPVLNQEDKSSLFGSGAMSRTSLSTKRPRHSTASVFRRARIVEIRNLTPEIEITHDCKPVILFRLAFPNIFSGKLKTCLPSFVFTFRGISRTGVTVERQYTPILLDNGQLPPSAMEEDEIALDFIISLVPGGKMSKIFLDLRSGKLMLAQGPTVNTNTLKLFKQVEWESVVMIASGTGIAPNLQAIDFYLAMLDPKSPSYSPDKPIPRMYLLWLIRGPEYDYGKALGLDRRVKMSSGNFHYTIVYSLKKESKVKTPSGDEKSDKKTTLPYGSWSFKSLVDKVKPQFLPQRRQTVKRLVLLRNNSKMNQSQSFKLSSGRLFLGLEDEPEIAPPGAVHTGDNKLTEKTWSGSIQHSTREYGKELLNELLESIPEKEELEAAVEPTTKKSSYIPPRSSVSFATTSKEEDDDEDDDDDASFNLEGLDPRQDLSADTKEEGGTEGAFGMSNLGMSKIMRLDHQMLVVISGAPMFEYKTLVALGELGVPKERTITFHASSTRI